MGKHDQVMHRLLERKEMFADLMNGCLYEGRQILQAEDLEMISQKYGLIYEKGKEGEEENECGDKRQKTGVIFIRIRVRSGKWME